MLLFHQVATRLSLTTCWQVGTTCNKSVALNNLVASCQQAGNRQCEHILLTSCWNSIATSLLQVCYNLCVLTYVDLMHLIGNGNGNGSGCEIWTSNPWHIGLRTKQIIYIHLSIVLLGFVYSVWVTPDFLPGVVNHLTLEFSVSFKTYLYNIKHNTCITHVKTHKLYRSANKLLQICSQVVDKLCSHCLFLDVVTSLEQASC
jgi:hypothetical protein